ncbi:hypothetical protein [Polyangium jinanense]|uniref:Tetratricopeptide repeat protein n=1 Tax=Polyangium jinanense TaxID=2829994 RepID=A0A9X3X4T6_9BACT|nr:hypothetical protein [Polyangium jinanense]MDC3958072.1 hypothetical protein [Polyangium jinanense]MDC3983729.1 hypothetical protein [Polyangium jinanense]
MAKDKKKRGASLDPEDVIAGRVRPEARELVALIRDVNPTGLGLDRRETARRYALKSRLQSVLVTHFRDGIEIRPEPGEPGVVLLHHRPSGLDACHAVVAELDDDARSFVQRVIDTAASPAIPAPEAPRKPTPRPHEGSRAGEAVPDLLRAAEDALAEYDYELARTHLEEALARSGGDVDAARALLALLVGTLGADKEALDIEETLPAETLADVHVRLLLALAAARREDRARALHLLPATSAKAPPARIAEIFVALAKSALATENLAVAADDLARARAMDATHPELAGLAATLAKARAATRGPAEAEASRLFAEGDLPGAEERAREILAAHPESDVARRILRGVEEQKKRDEARRKLDDAHEALERGETVQAVALLEAAKGLGLPEHEAAPAERRIAAKLAEARAREDEARVAAIAELIAASALAEGLAAYAALPAAGRIRVKEHASAKVLAWMDAVAPPGEGAKVKPAVAAIVALHRAAELAERAPETAMELVDAHGRVLQGFGPAEDVRKRAQAAIAEERRRVATGRVEAARRVMEAGDAAHASKLLGEVQRKDLPEEEVAAFDRFHAEVQRIVERHTLAASIEQLRREGDALRALAVCEELAARVEGEEAARIAALRGEIRAEVRRAFSVQVEVFEGEGVTAGPLAIFHDARVFPRWKWETMLVRTRNEREEAVLIVPSTRGPWVFVRVIDVATGALRTRVLLRTPRSLELLTFALRGHRLILAGRCGGVLEIDTDDWTVLAWWPNILRNDGAVVPTIEEGIFEDTLPELRIEEGTVSPDGRYLWLRTRSSRDMSNVIRVFDLQDSRLVREIREHRFPRVNIHSVEGLSAPRVVVVEADNEKDTGRTTFYSPRGAPSGAPIPTALLSLTVVPCPDGESVVGVACAEYGPKDPQGALWGFVQGGAGGVGPFQLFDGVTGIYEGTGVGSASAGMWFVLFDMQGDGPLLFGLRHGQAGPSIVYRVRVPRSSILLATPGNHHAALLVVHEGRPTIVPLDAEPPKVPEGHTTGAFFFPSLPVRSLYARRLLCHQPTGRHLAAAIAEERALRKEGKEGLKRRLAWAKSKAGPDELLAFEGGLYAIGEHATAGHVDELVCAKFPHHPRVRLSFARSLACVAEWRNALEQLDGIDPSQLSEEADVKHFHHLRGITLLMLGEPEAALVELDRSATYKEGTCEPEQLIPLCVPLSEERPWAPKQVLVRDYVRTLAAADEALARGDARAAQRVLDVPLVWEANEVQGFARLAETYLCEAEEHALVDRFRKAFALQSFCDLFDTRNTVTRREIPLPRATWDAERLSALAAKARAWVEEALSLPA